MKGIIVTTTFYKSVEELRFRLACDMVRVAIAHGHKVVIVDNSPIPEVAESLRKLNSEVFPQLHKGIGAGRREAFFHASEVARREKIDYIIWTEPEKIDFVRSIEYLISALVENKDTMGNRMADIVIPRRSEKSWETWPSFQVESEKAANQVYNRVFDVNGFDPMFGPVAFHVEVACYFILSVGNSVRPDTYIQHYAPIEARHDGKKVLSVEIDITYPPEQRTEEEGVAKEEMLEKRKWQLKTLTEAYRSYRPALFML